METSLVKPKKNCFREKLNDAKHYMIKRRYLYYMSIPGLAYIIIFRYIPMYGIIMAFQDFSFRLGIFGSKFNNFANFKQLFGSEQFYTVFSNSILLSISRLVVSFPVPIILALLLNEIKSLKFKKTSQTLMYLPHFISWVVLGGILTNFLSMNDGLINAFIVKLDGTKINFLGSAKWFRTVIIGSSIWKEAGWGTIIYLAGLSAINPEYYEAATVDGANRFQKLWYITLPSLANTIVIMLILSVGGIMNNGFEQIYLFQNGLNISVSQVFETYIYHIGIVGGRYSYSTAVELFKSVIAAVLLLFTNRIANKLRGTSLF
ncbi:MAG: ABC transporter permease subunit [Clostridiales bacterium]|nr:ABC transporter permease subunit [Clostridiales bacterium]